MFKIVVRKSSAMEQDKEENGSLAQCLWLSSFQSIFCTCILYLC